MVDVVAGGIDGEDEVVWRSGGGTGVGKEEEVVSWRGLCGVLVVGFQIFQIHISFFIKSVHHAPMNSCRRV